MTAAPVPYDAAEQRAIRLAALRLASVPDYPTAIAGGLCLPPIAEAACDVDPEEKPDGQAKSETAHA